MVERSASCILVHDGPGIAMAALDALGAAPQPRAVVIARRGITDWHRTLASRGALVLEGPLRALLTHLADTTLVVEQALSGAPHTPHVAAVPGPILTPATAGSNALLLRSDVEIVPDLEAWARRLAYIPQRDRHAVAID